MIPDFLLFLLLSKHSFSPRMYFVIKTMLLSLIEERSLSHTVALDINSSLRGGLPIILVRRKQRKMNGFETDIFTFFSKHLLTSK